MTAPADIIAKIAPWFARHGTDFVAVYGFGSSFDLSARPDSDIDLAVLSRVKISTATRWRIQNELADLLRRDVDLIDLSQANTVLRCQIVHEGLRIFCNDEYLADLFETASYSAFARLNESRREILSDILRRKSIYG